MPRNPQYQQQYQPQRQSASKKSQPFWPWLAVAAIAAISFGAATKPPVEPAPVQAPVAAEAIH